MLTFRTFPRAAAVVLTTAIAATALSLAPVTAEIASAATSPVPSVFATIQAFNVAHAQPAPYLRNGFIDDYATAQLKAQVACGIPCTQKKYHAPKATMPGNPVGDVFVFTESVTGTSTVAGRLAQKILSGDGGGAFGAAAHNYAGAAWLKKGTRTWITFVVAEYSAPPLDKMIAPKLSVTGKTRVGSKLDLSWGAFVPAPTIEIIQWKVGSTVVGSGDSYTPTFADLGGKVSVSITGTRAGYVSATTTASLSTKVTKGIFKPGTVILGGHRNVGSSLFVTEGNWFPIPAGFSYQWLRNGKVIQGQFGNQYTQTAKDLGKRIQVTVGGNTLGFVPASKTSKKPAVTGLPLFGVTTVPIIAGVAQYGQQLTASADPWGPGTVKYSYRWKVGGKSISGATKSAYLVRASDVGKKITFTITGKEAGFATQSVSSLPTAQVAPLNFTSVPAPVVSGTTFAGKTVKVLPGVWAPKATFKYQWYRNFVPIKGATHSTYKLLVKDDGQMSVGVFGSRPGYATAMTSALFTAFSK